MKSETEYIDLYLPDDFHHHLRDGLFNKCC